MKAWSLNYRDLAMPSGGYPGNSKVSNNPPLIPLSDGAGEIVELGTGVSQFAVGDRVAGSFFQNWAEGPINKDAMASGLGGAIDGVLAEEVVLSEKGIVKIPTDYSFAQAACLPCAAVTAFEALTVANTTKGDSVLTLGTGGVSLFVVQLAKALGANVFLTSSSDIKLHKAASLGADELINYNKTPDWDQEVIKRNNSSGVDHVIELGGAGTFSRSLNAAKVGGHISLIGVLTGDQVELPSPMPILFKRLCVQGIYVGPRSRFESLVTFIEKHEIYPVIDDKQFSFTQAQEAFRYLKSGAHFGKVVILAD
ncbi:UNVERIFIED_CONTAM: hypothetical protein GTU68_011024 [Idotea baltica]|nr:hypothetical protein [Idotea baltica]